jgi:Zn-dependent peptidase ImmA (M78 family)
MPTTTSPYDPYLHVYERWPGAEVVVEPLHRGLLGETRWPPLQIALAAQSSPAQRRCTLAHEIVHLERGLDDPGPWADREELQVHAEASRRLIDIEALADALRELGGSGDLAALAVALDVDVETIALRLRRLTPVERRRLRRRTRTELWSVA